jgi:hypothetical protein
MIGSSDDEFALLDAPTKSSGGAQRSSGNVEQRVDDDVMTRIAWMLG